LWRLHDEDEETREQLKEVMFDELIVGRGVAMNTLRYVCILASDGAQTRSQAMELVKPSFSASINVRRHRNPCLFSAATDMPPPLPPPTLAATVILISVLTHRDG
jgi:hypothetical protein